MRMLLAVYIQHRTANHKKFDEEMLSIEHFKVLLRADGRSHCLLTFWQ
jgi:hypothetical protein